jgi:hypothetical protein
MPLIDHREADQPREAFSVAQSFVPHERAFSTTIHARSASSACRRLVDVAATDAWLPGVRSRASPHGHSPNGPTERLQTRSAIRWTKISNPSSPVAGARDQPARWRPLHAEPVRTDARQLVAERLQTPECGPDAMSAYRPLESTAAAARFLDRALVHA